MPLEAVEATNAHEVGQIGVARGAPQPEVETEEAVIEDVADRPVVDTHPIEMHALDHQ